MVRTIEVVPHNPAWAERYNAEADILKPIIAQQLVSIHHIGSTAIPGIKAKPVIDILIVVKEINAIHGLVPEMASIGYDFRGEAGIPGRLYFRKHTDGIRSHHVHIFQHGHPNIVNHLNFRDFLRTHPEHAREYSLLKEELAEKYRHHSVDYTEGKTDFVNRINELAKEWRRSGNS